jgi:hypothetical protein
VGAVAPGEQRAVHQAGVVSVEHAIEDKLSRVLDAGVQFGHLALQALPLLGHRVLRLLLEPPQRIGGQQVQVFGCQDLVLDGVEYESIQLLGSDADPVTGRLVVGASGAVVQVGSLVLPPAGSDVDWTAAVSAAQPGRQQPAFPHADAALAVAVAGLALAGPHAALGLDLLEGVLVHRGVVGISIDDLALVDDVSLVDGVGQDLADVLALPDAGLAGGEI